MMPNPSADRNAGRDEVPRLLKLKYGDQADEKEREIAARERAHAREQLADMARRERPRRRRRSDLAVNFYFGPDGRLRHIEVCGRPPVSEIELFRWIEALDRHPEAADALQEILDQARRRRGRGA
jgi:hypothetical protein